MAISAVVIPLSAALGYALAMAAVKASVRAWNNAEGISQIAVPLGASPYSMGHPPTWRSGSLSASDEKGVPGVGASGSVLTAVNRLAA